MNLQVDCDDVVALHERVSSRAPDCVFLPLESKSYAGEAGEVVLVRRFIVRDPDGYLLRFSETG